jgi:sulfur relay (sulfurtransferase) complex TusBCD TusD component (DsrE family)
MKIAASFLRSAKWLVPVLALATVGTAATACATSPSAQAPTSSQNAPLFINLTSDDPHRVDMALSFGTNQLNRGHGLTVFLNDKAVYVASKAYAERFPAQQKTLADLTQKGAAVFVCPMCMEHYGIKKDDLLTGLKTSDPDTIGQSLFKPDTRTLNW